MPVDNKMTILETEKNRWQPKILYPWKLSFNSASKIKTFPDKQTLT